ncbi:hypothetical protein VZT92_018664 [Zoarces viviparus]|uniref:Uncharacterized protein n=1 Tax=Zoarces viviparus TaxID=48416 RepID=A0AAW1EI09_ZOAVI
MPRGVFDGPPAMEECCSLALPPRPKKPPELWNATQAAAAARPAGMGLEHRPILPLLPSPISLPPCPLGVDNMEATFVQTPKSLR